MHRRGLLQIFGLGIIVLGLTTMGLLRIPVLNRSVKSISPVSPQGPLWAFFIGVGFASCWVPCIAPMLGTILATAAATSAPAWDGVLLVPYSLGLGVAFVLLALGFGRALRPLARLRRWARLTEAAGGSLVVAVGVLFVTGQCLILLIPMQRWFARDGWPRNMIDRRRERRRGRRRWQPAGHGGPTTLARMSPLRMGGGAGGCRGSSGRHGRFSASWHCRSAASRTRYRPPVDLLPR
jgi:hypothetical protein